MQTLTRAQEQLLRKLIDLAGSPLIVQAALEELVDDATQSNAAGQAVTMEKLVKKIIEVRDRPRHPIPA